MSVQAISWAIERSQHKGAPLLVLIMIANHSHSDGSGAWPSIPTLARECRMSERQVKRIISGILEPSGELEVVRSPGRSNEYVIRMDPGQDVTGAVPQMSPVPVTFQAATSDIAMSPESKATVLEPSLPPTGVAALEETSAFPDLDEDVQATLKALANRAPEFPTTQLVDVELWREIDEQSERHDDVYYLDELARYVDWWALQPKGSRHRNVKRGFTRWIRKEFSRDEWRARNGQKAARR
jgi:hypothetical protein